MQKETLVFSIALGTYNVLFKKCIESHKEYCAKHGYEYKLITHTNKDLTPSESSWLKIPLIVNALEAGYKNVFFIDADCEVRKHAPALKEMMQGDKSLFLAPGFSGRINAGIIIVKSTPESLAFFRNILDVCEMIIPKPDNAAYENGHMIHFGKNSPLVKMIPHELWNNNSKFDEQAYIQHFSNGKLRLKYLADNRITHIKVRFMILFAKLRGKPVTDTDSKEGLRENLFALKEYHTEEMK